MLWQTTHVVVRLDGVRFAGFSAGRLDDVRIDRALSQPFGIDQFLGFGVEHFNKLATDDLALLLRVAHTLEVAKELLGCIDMHYLDTQTAGEGFHDLLGFVESQQTIVDKDTGELIANRAMDQRSGDRRINTARQPQNNFFVAHLGTDLLNGLFHIVRHGPVSSAATDVVYETGEHLFALQRMGHFRVELNGVETTIFIGHSGDRCRFVVTNHLEARR